MVGAYQTYKLISISYNILRPLVTLKVDPLQRRILGTRLSPLQKCVKLKDTLYVIQLKLYFHEQVS